MANDDLDPDELYHTVRRATRDGMREVLWDVHIRELPVDSALDGHRLIEGSTVRRQSVIAG